jgi:hypothetical protein
VSGGIVKKQPVSDNFFRNVVRAGVDQARKDVQVQPRLRPEASALVREAEQAGRGHADHRPGRPGAARPSRR